jgi:hypothetical protein
MPCKWYLSRADLIESATFDARMLSGMLNQLSFCLYCGYTATTWYYLASANGLTAVSV